MSGNCRIIGSTSSASLGLCGLHKGRFTFFYLCVCVYIYIYVCVCVCVCVYVRTYVCNVCNACVYACV